MRWVLKIGLWDKTLADLLLMRIKGNQGRTEKLAHETLENYNQSPNSLRVLLP